MNLRKEYRFFYHYNKKEKKMTIHFRKKCYIAKEIRCFRMCETKWKESQPNLVMQGWASEVVINNDKAIIR